jgi:protoporphyrinogen oxidase
MESINRRDLIATLLGASAANMAGCSKQQTSQVQGELLGPDSDSGHRLRDTSLQPGSIQDWREIPVVIVGGGIAGLSAAWRLKRKGFEDFALLELEAKLGGTSRSDSSGSFHYPWGAHYITTPLPTNKDLIEFLIEMGVVQKVSNDGTPIVAEEYLCREPEERIFVDGHWHEGLFPQTIANKDDLDQYAAFNEQIQYWANERDVQGRRFFDLPIANCSDDPRGQELDRISMLDWLGQQGWNSPILRWFVDYACRDDYGLSIDRTSAWAGILYFAARLKNKDHSMQDVITWPAGNGQVVEYLSQQIPQHIRKRFMVTRIHPSDQSSRGATCELIGLDLDKNSWSGYRTKRVIWAGPQFVASRVIDRFRNGNTNTPTPFRYGWWLVANVHLRDRPQDLGESLCWDNVFYESNSLGYVVSTHQSGIDHGPCVWTWYYPFADQPPKYSREQLLAVPWSDWVELVLTDLQRAHPKICELVTRVDVFRWGHAMVQPYTGFVWSQTRRDSVVPDRNVHFANTDLSGVALMEEAFYHGVRAADEILEILS